MKYSFSSRLFLFLPLLIAVTISAVQPQVFFVCFGERGHVVVESLPRIASHNHHEEPVCTGHDDATDDSDCCGACNDVDLPDQFLKYRRTQATGFDHQYAGVLPMTVPVDAFATISEGRQAIPGGLPDPSPTFPLAPSVLLC